MTDAATIDTALERLLRAVDHLENSLSRQREGDRARADVETELAAAQDDRQRLAAELDATTARAERLDSAATEIDRRLETALIDVAALAAAVKQHGG